MTRLSPTKSAADITSQHEANASQSSEQTACVATSASASAYADIEKNPYKASFPLLANHPDMAYLDSAATTQRPTCVLNAERDFYETMNANPLRGLYSLSVQATEAIAQVRAQIATLIGAVDDTGRPLEHDVVFTRNTTESLNLVAKSFAPTVLSPGDEVAITIMEHHSNLIPWQQACQAAGATLVYLYPDKTGELSDDEIAAKIGPHTKIVATTLISNVLGCRVPVEKLGRAIHTQGGYLVVDAAQAIAHTPVDVREIDADFLAFSGHKALGPTGIGVLWGKHDLFNQAEPFLTGGEMIDSVSEQDATWAAVPEKFEAGTQDAAGIYATGVALDYLSTIVGYEAIETREANLVRYALERMKQLPYIDILGSQNPSCHLGVISFNVHGIHPHDVASILDMQNVCIRAGHHCAQPLLTWLNCENLACCRASLAFYNDKQDIDALIDGLEVVWQTFHS